MSVKSSEYVFSTPPLQEIAIGVQFEEPEAFRSTHFGKYHQTIEDRFPIVEDQPRLPPLLESFPQALQSQGLVLKLFQGKRGPERVFFRNSDGELLIQVQPDRFGVNWRKVPENSQNQRFCLNGTFFLEEFEGFEAFCSANGIPTLHPNMCEVIYVNQIVPMVGESAIACLESVLALDSIEYDGLLPAAEAVSFNRAFPLGDKKGRIYVESGIGRSPTDDHDHVELKITVRVLHRMGDVLKDNLQMAHDAAVGGFIAVTTSKAKTLRWGAKL